MKKLIPVLLSLFMLSPCMANIHISPAALNIAVYDSDVPADKRTAVLQEYKAQLEPSPSDGISAQKLWNLCTAAGWDIKTSNGKSKCQDFVNTLVRKSTISMHMACDKKYKGKSGYICVDKFFTNKVYGGTQVNIGPALALAKEYIRIKHNDTSVQCAQKPREITVMAGATDYGVQCTSRDKDAYYELIFDDTYESEDKKIKNSIQTAICKMYDADAQHGTCDTDTDPSSGNFGELGTGIACYPATCTADSAKCAKINESMAKFGYSANYINKTCEINFNTVTKQEDLKTAYGIDNFVFCHGIQVANAPNVETYLKQYVAQRAGVSASSVKCDSGFNTYTGTGCAVNGMTNLTDDIKTCRVGNNQIDFVFDDINEKWKKTVEGGVQGMSCIVTGGTYSGERCIGLGEQQCNVLRQSNLKECPECKAAKWDPDTESCILPSSKSAQNLQKGVNICLIVGGAVVGVVLTVATVGTATAAVAGTAAATKSAIAFTAIETVGAGIELTSQLKINGIADEFLVESNKCNSESCAIELVNKYLTELARIGRDLTDAEADATDKEMARLVGLIPASSDWWIESLKTDDGSSLLEKANDGGWTAAQLWRAIGIGMQFVGVVSSITGWIIKKAGYLEKTLDRTSKILLNSAKTAEKNIVKVDKLDDVGKEWYKLWQEYAPKNQTLEQFKAMTNGNLDEMKQMVKNWTPRSKKGIINTQIDKQLDDITAEVQRRSTTLENLMDKYNIDAMPADPNELAQLYKQHPDLEQAAKTLDYARAQQTKLEDARVHYNNTSYSTFDPEFGKTFAAQRKIDNLEKQRAAIEAQQKELVNKGAKLNKEAKKYGLDDPRGRELRAQARAEYAKYLELDDELDQLNKEKDVLEKQLPTQWDVAEKYQLQNLGNVVNERADDFAEIIANNPEIKAKLDPETWQKLVDADKAKEIELMNQIAENPTIKSKLSSDWQKLSLEKRKQELMDLYEHDVEAQNILRDIGGRVKLERTEVAQQILDEYAKKTKTPISDVYGDLFTKWGGYHTHNTNNVVFNPNAQLLDPDGMVETLAHEHGHLIDDLAPNEGALGEQYNYYIKKIHNNKKDAGYRVALSEQSSYKIGPNVSHEATGTTHYSYGNEYALEEAKRTISEANEELDSQVATAATGGALIGGAAKQVIDAKRNKKDKK